jgi:hypothetical protein
MSLNWLPFPKKSFCLDYLSYSSDLPSGRGWPELSAQTPTTTLENTTNQASWIYLPRTKRSLWLKILNGASKPAWGGGALLIATQAAICILRRASTKRKPLSKEHRRNTWKLQTWGKGPEYLSNIYSILLTFLLVYLFIPIFFNFFLLFSPFLFLFLFHFPQLYLPLPYKSLNECFFSTAILYLSYPSYSAIINNRTIFSHIRVLLPCNPHISHIFSPLPVVLLYLLLYYHYFYFLRFNPYASILFPRHPSVYR